MSCADKLIGQVSQQDISQVLDKISKSTTVAGVTCLAVCQLAAPALLTTGSITGTASTILDDTKPMDQRLLNVVVRGLAGKAGQKVLGNIAEV